MRPVGIDDAKLRQTGSGPEIVVNDLTAAPPSSFHEFLLHVAPRRRRGRSVTLTEYGEAALTGRSDLQFGQSIPVPQADQPAAGTVQ
jgi:hypothetical protein